MEYPAIYLMEPIGVDGELEAVETLHFCSDSCAISYATSNLQIEQYRYGTSPDAIDGAACDECGKLLA